MTLSKTVPRIYQKLYQTFGPQLWWPGETPFEIIVGAILTQNTNWKNVEKAIVNLKKDNLLSPQQVHKASLSKLAKAIRPSGFFNVKAVRLKNFVEFLFKEYGGDLKRMEKEPVEVLRKKILQVNGIGPETADSILLYALHKKSFVVDAYTKRIFFRHNLIGRKDDYHAVQKIFTENFDRDIQAWNEYHALIVRLGKEFCRPTPLCSECPINNLSYSLEDKCGKCHLFLSSETSEKPLRRMKFCAACRKSN